MKTMPLSEIKQLVTTELYINGQFQQGSGTTAISVTNPFDNEEICRVVPASEAQVQNAIEAAATSFKSSAWQSLTGRDRGTLLYRLAELLRRDLEIFATLESVDTGIPIRETRMEVATSAQHFEYYVGLAGKIDCLYQGRGPRLNYVRGEAYGVLGQIVTGNTPLKLMARGFAAAVACGNTMVVKPSVVAPLSNLRFGELGDEGGFPPGTR